MRTSGMLQIDPGALDTRGGGGGIDIVVPFSEGALTESVLQRAAVLTAGLEAAVRLVAVHAIPYPLPFYFPVAERAHLEKRLADLASRSPVAVCPQLVLARYPDEGFRSLLKPTSIVLVGARKRIWPTREERLARSLARDGHRVALIHIS